jgi:hypothetical protein
VGEKRNREGAGRRRAGGSQGAGTAPPDEVIGEHKHASDWGLEARVSPWGLLLYGCGEKIDG